MIKRLLLKTALCIGLFAFLGSNAHAGYPATVGGWYATWGSVCVWAEWKGVQNYEITPTDADVTLFVQKVQLHYLNPAGQPGGDGQPFYPNVEISIDGRLDDSVSKNGKYEMLLCFENNELYNLIVESGVEIPKIPNPKWTLDPDNPVVVLEMFVRIRGYSDLDGDLEIETETAHVAGPCILNVDEYICETEEEWYWDKKNPTEDCPFCPYPGE